MEVKRDRWQKAAGPDKPPLGTFHEPRRIDDCFHASEAMAKFTKTANQRQRGSQWATAVLRLVLRISAASALFQPLAKGTQRGTEPLPQRACPTLPNRRGKFDQSPLRSLFPLLGSGR